MNIREISQHPFVSLASYVILVIFIVLWVKAYLGYLTMSQAIENNNLKNKSLQEQIIYLRDCRLAYLESEYADYFISHENGIAHQGEKVIKIEKKSEQPIVTNQIISPSGQVRKDNGTGKWRAGYLRFKVNQISK